MTTEQITEAPKQRLIRETACPECGEFQHGPGEDDAHAFFAPQREVIVERDWVTCPVCECGNPDLCNLPQPHNHYEDCPDCVGGLVPSPELIKRVGDIEVQNPEDGGGMALGDLIGGDRVVAVLLASRQGDTL